MSNPAGHGGAASTSAAADLLALVHGCAEPGRCRHQLAARCAVNGQILCLYESAWLTGQERRRAQRDLRAATSEEQAARVVRHAEMIGTLRRIEREALEARREELRTDPAGYRRRHRAVADAIRRCNLRKRREADARRPAEAAPAAARSPVSELPAADEPRLATVAGWLQVAAAVVSDLGVLCGPEVRALLDLALRDPAAARASSARFAAARRTIESGAEHEALGVAETLAWAQLFGPRSANWTGALTSAAGAHGGAAYAAAMTAHARTRNDEANRERRAVAARAEARAAAEARYAAWVTEARKAEIEAEAEQAKAFAASLRGADALSKARAAHLLRVAEAPAGFAPHEHFAGAKLGAWTRALRHLARLDLVQDVGWRWVLTAEGSAIAQRLAERRESRAYVLRQRQAAASARAQRAADATARTERAVPRPADRARLRTRTLRRAVVQNKHGARVARRVDRCVDLRRGAPTEVRRLAHSGRRPPGARRRDGPARVPRGMRRRAA